MNKMNDTHQFSRQNLYIFSLISCVCVCQRVNWIPDFRRYNVFHRNPLIQSDNKLPPKTQTCTPYNCPLFAVHSSRNGEQIISDFECVNVERVAVLWLLCQSHFHLDLNFRLHKRVLAWSDHSICLIKIPFSVAYLSAYSAPCRLSCHNNTWSKRIANRKSP